MFETWGMEILKGKAHASFLVNLGPILPRHTNRAGKRCKLLGRLHVPFNLSSIECRQRRHASAGSRKGIDTEKLPTGQDGQKWASAQVVENK
jgi:hypothetical protein